MAIKLYEWQREAIEVIRKNPEKNILITAPTSSGKTLVSYAFADMLDLETGELKNPKEKVIYTVPIKSLANDKFYELSQLGLNVGISTGDVKILDKSDIVICTQEVYQDVFKGEGFKVIIDEFHYAFQNPQRSLAFVDLHPNDRYLFSSATIKVSEELIRYLEKVSGREVVHYHTDFRPTELVFQDEPLDEEKAKEIYKFGNVILSVAFTRNNLYEVAERIKEFVDETLPPEKMQRVYQLAQEYGIDLDKFKYDIEKGVMVYHGKLNYAEKVFIEQLAREKLLVSVVSTDAISLGVNFPISDVVFYQLTKFDGKEWRELYPSEFLQISGRAGRKGYYDVGRVWGVDYWLNVDAFNDTWEIFESLKDAPLEEPKIDVELSYADLLDFLLSYEEKIQNLSLSDISDARFAILEDEFMIENEKIRLDNADTENKEFIQDLINSWIDKVANIFQYRFPRPLTKEEILDDKDFLKTMLYFKLRFISTLKKDTANWKKLRKFLSIKELNPSFISSDLNSDDFPLSLLSLYKLTNTIAEQQTITSDMLSSVVDYLDDFLGNPEGKGKTYALAMKLFARMDLLGKPVEDKQINVLEYMLSLLEKEDRVLWKLMQRSYKRKLQSNPNRNAEKNAEETLNRKSQGRKKIRL